MNRLNGVASERVKLQTGRDWAEWIAWLDQKQAAGLNHKAIVELVYGETQKSWWSQMVTVGYEQAKGLRARHQASDGFQVSVSKTFDQPLAKVFAGWDKRLGEWYDGPKFEITTNNLNKNLRGKFADGSALAVGFLATKTGKTQVSLEQSKLPSATATEQARRFWKEQLEHLGRVL